MQQSFRTSALHCGVVVPNFGVQTRELSGPRSTESLSLGEGLDLYFLKNFEASLMPTLS